MTSAQSEQQSFFPLELLGKGEALLLPVRLSMKYDDADSQFLENLSSEPGTLPSNLPDPVELSVFENKAEQVVRIGNTTLLQCAQKPKPQVDRSREYIFGPSIQLESVVINGTPVPIRSFDPKSIVIRSGVPMGSCPYAFAYSRKENRWLPLGHILYGVNSKAKESTDAKILKSFDGRIRMREMEPETSFIDSMQVDVECSGSKASTVLPNNDLVKRRDGRYLELRQGDDVIIQFDAAAPSGCKATLRTTGYYQRN
jgi:hypothetical protein